MEPYIGTWSFVESDNFDAYLKAMAIPLPLRKLANLTSPTVTITKEDSGKFSLKTDAVVRSVTVVFKLGEQIDDETTVDFRKVKSTFTIDEEGQLVWTSLDIKSGITTVVKRRVDPDGIMYVTMEAKGVVATAKFKRL